MQQSETLPLNQGAIMDAKAPSALKQYQDALIELCVGQECDHFITLATNREHFCLDQGRRHLWHLFAVLERRLLGCRWQKSKTPDRSFVLAVPELGHGHSPRHGAMSTGFHYHVLYRLPRWPRRILTEWGLKSLIEKTWCHSVPSGSVDVQLMSTEPNRRAASSYAFKHLGRNGFGQENWLFIPS